MPKKKVTLTKDEDEPVKKQSVKLSNYGGKAKKPAKELDDDIEDVLVEFEDDNGASQSNKKNGRLKKISKKGIRQEEDSDGEKSPIAKNPPKKGSKAIASNKSTQNKGKGKGKVNETQPIEEESDVEDKKPKKKGKGQTKAKKKEEDSDDDFKIDENGEDEGDMEEERNIRRSLNSKDGQDSGGDNYGSDDEDEKPKLKKVKKTNSKKPKAAPKPKTPKESQVKEEDMGLDMQNGPTSEMFNMEEDKSFDESSCYLPDFILDENIRDRNKKRPNEPGYDPTSVYIPPNSFDKNNFLQQYWEFKKDHYDKLVGIKLWKFYFFFYHDAFALHKLLDLKVNKWGKWTYVNFYETSLPKYSPKILGNGHKIVLVEQMEESKKGDKDLVKREICQILTRGTAIENQELDYSSRFVLCIFEENLTFGVVLCDTTTHEFHIGEFKDDINRSNLRTLLTRSKPVEVIYMKNYLEEDSLKMIRGLSTKPAVSNILVNYTKSVRTIFDENLAKYFTPKDAEAPVFPQILADMRAAFDNEATSKRYNLEGSQSVELEKTLAFYSTFQALAVCVEFLNSVLLAETVISMGNFSPFDLTLEKKSTLYLDSQALLNLEVLDVQYLNSLSETNSLLGYMDKTVTPFGKRMLRKWITSPLLDAEAIKERQDAVDDLLKNMDVADYFRERLGKLPDIERMVNKIYNLSSKQRMAGVYFEDFAKNRLKDFLAFLKELRKIEDLVETFTDYVPNFNSKRLIELTTFKEVDIQAFKDRKKVNTKRTKGKPAGVFPRINHLLDDIEGMIELRDNIPMPAPGVSPESDDLIEKITEVKSILQDYLEKQRKKFNNNDIKYAHTKHRYELEVPEHLVEGSKRPKDYAITSKRKGYLRFHTPEIEACLRKLLHYEHDFQKVFIPFVCEYFKKFYERNNYWQQVISCLSELDCLCSLAQLATTMDLKCRPEVLPIGDERIFELKDMVHPMAARTNFNFVPNSIILEEPMDTFLITGPNMGGKSTLLRQSCLAVIMAQIGSYIPARYFRLNAIDRIFTRIGASDRIFEGKSTFFIEMEETFNIVSEATQNSLLILDELGRGTSTYDGVSIAYGVLKYIAEQIGCITLFATHYHLLLEEFKLYKNIENYYMLCEFDEKKDEIKFLYKFVKGEAAKSHGVVIAKMAGLPENITKVAKEKAEFMTKEKRNISFERNLLEKFNKTIEELSLIEGEDGNGFNPNVDVDKLLHELQQLH